MKFTLPWLKDYLDTNADLPAILEAMTQAGLEVEDAHDPKDALKQFTVCRIVSAAQQIAWPSEGECTVFVSVCSRPPRASSPRMPMIPPARCTSSM